MFIIRPSEDVDCEDIYQQSKDLLKEHDNQGEDSRMNAEEFRAIHAERFVHFQVLTTRAEKVAFVGVDKWEENGQSGAQEEWERETSKKQVVGYIAFADDYDLHFGGKGLLVDQFFICERFRGKGLGRSLLNSVRGQARKRSAKYIKLFYQQTPEREAIYSHLGFTNVSEPSPFIRYFEVYGPDQMRERFNVDVYEDFESAAQTLPVRPGIEVITYQQAHGSQDGYGRLYLLFSLSTGDEVSTAPSADLVVLIKHSRRIHSLPGLFEVHSLKRFLSRRGICIDDPPLALWTQISTISGEAPAEPSGEADVLICAFVERPTVCCWLGHQLTFSNFVGNLGMISEDLLVQRIQAWSPRWGPLLGVNFEVAGDETQSPSAGNNELVSLLNSLGVQDDPSWTCAIMLEKTIRESDSA